MTIVSVSPVAGMAFLSAVYRQNWTIALMHLNGCNMYEMLRLLDQIDRADLNLLVLATPNVQFTVNLNRIMFAVTVVLKRAAPTSPVDDPNAVPDARNFLARRSPLRIPTDPTSIVPAAEPGKAGLTVADFDQCAGDLGVERAAVQAVARVESGGRSGFARDGRCIIRYELHTFQKRTGSAYSATHPHLSNSYKAGIAYHSGGQANEWSLMYGALMLRGRAEDAQASASWGMFQVMGFNHRAAGYGSAGEFATAMCASAANQLKGFVKLCQSNGWDRYLANKDWAGFAKHYNGPSYRDNHYDTHLEAAYRQFSGES